MMCALFFLSILGGICSGLLGVGGAVLLIPLFLIVPRWLGLGELSMHEVTGLTMIQVCAASVTGWLSHRRGGFTHKPTILSIGIPMGIFSFVGAALSKSMSGETMIVIFGCLVAVAFLMLLKGTEGESFETKDFEFKMLLSIGSGSCVGFMAGIVGAGGGFILIPVMIKLLKVPIRVTVGSSLGILLIGALMGSLGKILTLQVEWAYLLPVIAGALPASFIGAHLSKKIPAPHLRRMLLLLVSVILIKTWHDLFRMFISHQ